MRRLPSWAALLAGLALAAGGGVPLAMAQGRVILAPVPDADERMLDRATARLATNPSDLQALRDGAQAAMRIGEYDAALGFLNRAEVIAPTDPVIRAARASILVYSGHARTALPLFQEAELAGARASDFAQDRGLAHDLLGDQASAQYYYRIAAQVAPGPELTRRFAFSLAVAGEMPQAEAMLKPLLQADDPAAWRIRAFMLAIGGRTGESVTMLYAVLPAELAASLAPYMRSMTRLSPGQKVAAALLGMFPADIGAQASGLPGRGQPRGESGAAGAATGARVTQRLPAQSPAVLPDGSGDDPGDQ